MTIPLKIVDHVLGESRVHVSQEGLVILPDVFGSIQSLVPVLLRIFRNFKSILKFILNFSKKALQTLVILVLNLFEVLLRQSDHFLEVLQINRVFDLSDFLLNFDVLLASFFNLLVLYATDLIYLQNRLSRYLLG